MITSRWLQLICGLVLVAIAPSARAQETRNVSPQARNPHATESADQVAKILGISQLAGKARLLHSGTPCEATPTLEELSIRQDIMDTVLTASLEVDGVLAELENERAHLSELSSILQARRDRAVNLINLASLITGSGLGIAVNAMQFSTSTANIGNGIGVGSGVGSTLLSIIGIRRQAGPQRSVGRVPNMLAPLFARKAALNSFYPQAVMDYLHAAPPGDDTNGASRLDQLMAEWKQSGRVGPPGSPKTEDKIARLTSSLGDKTRLSIDDLSDRVAMLADVTGRVGLMKRDLAGLMRSIRAEDRCQH